MTDANVVALVPTEHVHPLKAFKDAWISPPREMIQKKDNGRGVMLDYLGHAEATNALLETDIEYTFEPVCDGRGIPIIELAASGEEYVMWGYLNVCGVRRMGVGSVPAKVKRKVNGQDVWVPKTDIEKELIGDCIRNIGMRFGLALDLWAKSDLAEGQDSGPAPRDVARKADTAQAVAKFFDLSSDNSAGMGEGTPDYVMPPAGERPISAPQINLIKSLLRGRTDLADVAAEHALMSQLVGREIKSTKDLTMPEAKRVIDHLKGND